jgi:hypothetical protein
LIFSVKTAADTRVQTIVSKNLLLEKLTSYMGSDQSPLLVPGGSRVLAAILVAWTKPKMYNNFFGVNDGSVGANNTAAWIRLSGAGLIDGEKTVLSRQSFIGSKHSHRSPRKRSSNRELF